MLAFEGLSVHFMWDLSVFILSANNTYPHEQPAHIAFPFRVRIPHNNAEVYEISLNLKKVAGGSVQYGNWQLQLRLCCDCCIMITN